MSGGEFDADLIYNETRKVDKHKKTFMLMCVCVCVCVIWIREGDGEGERERDW